jgi:plasmid stabilization system protein ParE
MQGLLALVATGYMSYLTKQWLANQPIETNPKRIAGEVLDKSNLLAWLGEAIYPALWEGGFKDFSRWSDRDAVETILGPSAGTVADIYERRLPAKLRGSAIDDPTVGSFTRSDLHFLRRLVPGQNLWYARRAVNGLEDSMGDLFGLRGESNADRLARTNP